MFDVIVIGAGHAGVEAAWAAARLGRRVAICTLSAGTVAHMPCNPAVGGTAKAPALDAKAAGMSKEAAIKAQGISARIKLRMVISFFRVSVRAPRNLRARSRSLKENQR